mgnify:CR=1 FL=1
MGLWDILMENFSNSPEWKGKRFEKFVIEKFNRKYFDIVEMTHSWKPTRNAMLKAASILILFSDITQQMRYLRLNANIAPN